MAGRLFSSFLENKAIVSQAAYTNRPKNHSLLTMSQGFLNALTTKLHFAADGKSVKKEEMTVKQCAMMSYTDEQLTSLDL
jgi:hypothetical protein